MGPGCGTGPGEWDRWVGGRGVGCGDMMWDGARGMGHGAGPGEWDGGQGMGQDQG